MSEWISVERLPERRAESPHSKAVLVYCPESKCTYCATYDFYAGQWEWFGGQRGVINSRVSHWMPVPMRPVRSERELAVDEMMAVAEGKSGRDIFEALYDSGQWRKV